MMRAMSRQRVLARVEDDLARGHTYLALQRLASLVENHPRSLDLRERRGAVNHQIGNFVEAGRWSYLAEEADPDDIAAFERAFRAPWDRLLALGLRHDPAPWLGPVALARLGELTAAAAASGTPVVWTDRGPQAAPGETRIDRLVGVGCGTLAAATALAFVGLAIYGLVQLIG